MSKERNIFQTVFHSIRTLARKISMYPLDRKKRCISLLLLTFIIIGFILRIYDLTSRPFLADEGISTMAAIDISKTGYPPIVPGGGTYWRSVFHTSSMAGFFLLFEISVFFARLPSVIFGTLTILLIYFFGKELKNWKVGLISAFLLSINYLAIDLSREARMYATFQFFYLLSLFLFYKGFESKKGNTYKLIKDRIILESISFVYVILSVVTFIISILCHQLTVVIIPGIIGYGLVLGYINWKKTESSKRYLDKYLFLALLIILLSIVSFLIVISSSFRYEITSLLPYINFNLRGFLSSNRYYGLYILEHFPLEFSFAAMGFAILIVKREKYGAFLMTSLIIPLLLQLFFFNFLYIGAKYIFHLIPLFLILSAYGIHEIAVYLNVDDILKDKKNINPRFFVIMLSLFLIFAGFSYALLATQRGKIASPYWREACEYVLFNSQNDTSLIASVGIIPYFFLESDEYGLRSDYPEYAHKNITIFDRPYLHTREDLMNMTRTYDNGWVLVDMDRWNWEAVITEDAKAYLQENMTYHPYKYHMHLFIYSWDNE